MSLNFDLKAVAARLGEARYNKVTTSPETRGLPEDKQKWHPVTNTLIWLSLAVGLRDITEKNVDEWCFRIGLLRAIDPSTSELSGFANGKRVPIFLARQDIEDHIGLQTNVTEEKRGVWLQRIFSKYSSAVDDVSVKEGESAHDKIEALSTESEPRVKIAPGQLWSMADGGTARVINVNEHRATLKWNRIGVTGATIGRVFDVDLDGKAYSRTGVRFEKRDLVECLEQA